MNIHSPDGRPPGWTSAGHRARLDWLRALAARLLSPWYRLNLMPRFIVTGLSLTIAIGFVLGWAIGAELERSALAQEAESAADSMKLLVDPFLRPEDFDGPPSPTRYDEVDRRIRGTVLRSHIVRVKIWNRAGVVIYSDDPAAVGQQHAVEEELAEALGGRVGTGISSLGKEENLTERGRYSRLMEIYVPIGLEGGPVIGAYELYHDMAVIEPHIASMQRFLWVSLALALGVLFFALFGIVRHASLLLRRQAEELSRLESQREIDRFATELVSVVSHELRTPLTALVGFSELLLTQQASEPERREWTEAMHTGAERLMHLVEELLNVARIDEGRLELHQQPVDVRAAVQEALAPFQVQAAAHRLQAEYREPLPLALADRDKLAQVLTNLISNAIKYSPRGGVVRVSVEATNGTVHLAVSDQGLGLPAQELPRMFERFHRIQDESRQEIQGTGLGLYITRNLVELQEGRIWVESPGPGRGSTFHVELPMAVAEPAHV